MKTDWKFTLKIEAPFGEKGANAALAALKSECGGTARFESEIRAEKGVLVVELRAADATALRSAANSFLRYLQTMDGAKAALSE
jgi:tRNA threonylcarbamoyladenosine modification (KEOPS) complex  Pcc1 subunit